MHSVRGCVYCEIWVEPRLGHPHVSIHSITWPEWLSRVHPLQVHRKLESWALQYSLMLSSGLEEQRLLFERRLLELRAAQQHEKSTAAKARKHPSPLSLPTIPMLTNVEKCAHGCSRVGRLGLHLSET